jgi:hypothetical protein
MLAGHDEGVPLARRKLAKLNDGRPAHRSERDGSVYLEPARATLRVSEDDVRVGNVFERDGARLLETRSRRVEQVDDWAAPTMYVERCFPDDGQLLD